MIGLIDVNYHKDNNFESNSQQTLITNGNATDVNYHKDNNFESNSQQYIIRSYVNRRCELSQR